MRTVVALSAAVALVAACSDAGGVDPDAISGPEKAAVQAALNSALANDSLYPTLALLVFPYVDRATRVISGSDTTRVVGIQLDINVGVVDSANDTIPVVAQLSAALAWSGYDSTAHTVDTVFFVIGSGLAPVSDTLRQRFSPDTAGTGTAFVIHQTGASSYATWLARQGALHVTSASFGAMHTQGFGTLHLGVARGTAAGDFHTTAKLVPDSATTVTTARDYAGGVQALKLQITGVY